MTTVREPLAWREEFATGIEEIDDQHMILVETLNEARVVLAGPDDTAAIDDITRDLLSYALYHFETEEQLMNEFGYAQAEPAAAGAHVSEHRGFSARVVAMRDAIHTGAALQHGELLGFLEEWLVDHILKTDRRFGEFILARRPDRR